MLFISGGAIKNFKKFLNYQMPTEDSSDTYVISASQIWLIYTLLQ